MRAIRQTQPCLPHEALPVTRVRCGTCHFSDKLLLTGLTAILLTLAATASQSAVLDSPTSSAPAVPGTLRHTPSLTSPVNAASLGLQQQASEPGNPVDNTRPTDPVSGWLHGNDASAALHPRSAPTGPQVLLPPPAPRRNTRSLRKRPAKAQCRQAAQFVLQAAMARDAGMSPALFLATLERDLDTLLARPLHQRWFVRSPVEAGLIRFAAVAVFNRPASAAQHGRQFQLICRQYQRQANKTLQRGRR